MKKSILLIFSLASTLCILAQSTYDHREAFNPQFYPYPGNDFRSASGEPGPRYWQNRASPDALRFIWLQLDQNIYKKDSRGSATTTEAGGRWANGGFTNGVEISNMQVETGSIYSAALNTVTTDTRMQVWLKNPLAKGASVKLKMNYQFVIPEYGTDRMGRLNTKKGWVYEVAQWFPRVAVYDDVQGWNTMPYLGAGEFYLEYGDIEFNITAPSDLIIVGSGELRVNY